MTVSGDLCDFDPFAKKQLGACGAVLGQLSQLGVSYSRGNEMPVGAPTDWVIVKAGSEKLDLKTSRRDWKRRIMTLPDKYHLTISH